MKSMFYFLLLSLAFFFLNGTIDLDNLSDYANQPVPNYVNRDNTPNNNQITDLGATLGRVLFYDKNLSANNTISCASCHKQEFAFGDDVIQSVGLSGGLTGRHSMRLVNARFAQEDNFFWDERAGSLEEQTTMPIQDHIEMGFSGTNGDPTFDELITKLSQIDYYQQLFTEAYGDSDITEERMQSALAQFIRSIQSFDAKYDAGLAQTGNPNAPFPNFTTQENQGKQLFMAPPNQNGANCQTCHRAPTFDIVPNSRNNGVIGVAGNPTAVDVTNTRAPSLRDLVNPTGQLNGPMMHDGSMTSLLEVINHYDQIIVDPRNNNLDNRLRGGRGGRGGNGQNLNLTEAEKEALVAFLGTLTGSAIYTDERWSDPFDASGNLAIINGTVIDADGDGFSVEVDCDDTNAAIHPNALEIPNNNIDENCDGGIAIIDNDNDGFNSDEDCDDTNAAIHPNAAEIPDNDMDENCDGIVAVTEVIDNDNDGFNSDEDCDDNNPLIHPNATEIVDNNIDENCDGLAAVSAEEENTTEEEINTSNNCSTPTQIIANLNNRRRVTIRWATMANAISYELRLRVQNTNRWLLTTRTRRNRITLVGPSNIYEFQIRTICGNGITSDFSPIETFPLRRRNLEAAAIRSNDHSSSDVIIPTTTLDGEVSVFPNPAQNIVHLKYATTQPAKLTIQHISGQVIVQKILGEQTDLHSINCSTFEAGIYLIVIEEEGKAPTLQRFVKAKRR